MFPVFSPKDFPLTPFLFFTGKGGVGKTSAASALAVELVNSGKKVLIVSTDPASNLQDVFEIELTNDIMPLPALPGLSACNLDPEEAARKYREKVVGPYRGKLPGSVIQSMEEQLSGACTVEIAAFDEFTGLLASPDLKESYDHIIFDTAPTGHTLRLLQLPSAWTDFLNESTHGASCLGPLSGLDEKKELYAQTVKALSDPKQTTLMLVSRPDQGSLQEAARASTELNEIGIQNQNLLLNGVHQAVVRGDEVSEAYYRKQQTAIAEMPISLKKVKTFEVPLVPFSLTGLTALGMLFQGTSVQAELDGKEATNKVDLPDFSGMINNLADSGKKIIFTMGKGGVGKTTVASAVAEGLAEKGKRVHLTTTDPAGRLEQLAQKEESSLISISRINPKEEVEKYKASVLSKASDTLDEASLEYMKEDLESPCTEEIALFQAFADIVARSKDEVVVIDTAPTGHTLLLLDAANSYSRELERSTGEIPLNAAELLPRLRNEEETEVVIVTLAEATPVFEAKRLQDDLKRAGINPGWWVINQSMHAAETNDPILKGRAAAEQKWIQEVSQNFAEHYTVIPWLNHDKIGYKDIKSMKGK